MDTIKDKKIKFDIENASKILGIKRSEFFERAVTFYLYSMKDNIALKKEFNALDKLSDEVFS